MKIEIIETRDLDNSTDVYKTTLVRLLDIDGVRHLQMQMRQHEIMRATWGDGLLMTCPTTLSLDDVVADPSAYYMGHGAGCEVLEDVPRELWQ